MSASNPRMGGMAVARRADGEYLFQETPRSIELANVFDHFTSTSSAFSDLPNGAQILLSLVINDAVILASDLRSIAVASTIWTDGQHVAVEWPRRNGWVDRRYLHPDTVALMTVNVGAIASTRDWKAAARYLAANVPGASANPWHTIFEAAQAWWYTQLPGPLFSHCAGLQKLQPLDRTAHARRATRRPLDKKEDEPVARTLSDLTERIDLITARTMQTSTAQATVQAVREVASQHRDEAASRGLMEARLKEVFGVALNHGRPQAIVVAGTISVVVEGGVLGRLLKPRTLATYIGHCVEPLLVALLDPSALDVYELAPLNRLQLYRSVVDNAPQTAADQVAAFLMAMDRYLVATGCPPLEIGLGKELPSAPPFARTVFDFELTVARDLVANSEIRQRVRDQALVMLAIAPELPIRTGEIWSLLIGHIAEVDGAGCIVHIHPMRRYGGSKTPSARRDVPIDSPTSVKSILDWKARRLSEGAGPNELLFGDPVHAGKTYEQALTLQVLGWALKTATGDPSMSLYALRHAAVGKLASLALMPADRCDDTTPLANVAAISGHAGFASSRTYFNEYETPLEAWCRLARPAQIPLDPDTRSLLPTVDAGISMGNAVNALDQRCGVSDVGASSNLSPRLVLFVLRDLAQGKEMATTALRNGIPEERLHALLDITALSIALHNLDGGERIAEVRWATLANLRRLSTWITAAERLKFSPVWQAIDQAFEDGTLAADFPLIIASWSACIVGEDLSIDRRTAAQPVIGFLSNCYQSGRNRLVSCTEKSRPNAIDAVKRKGWETRLVPIRRGRAHTRLHICSVPTDEQPSGAAIGMQGLHAIFLAVDVAIRCRGLRGV